MNFRASNHKLFVSANLWLCPHTQATFLSSDQLCLNYNFTVEHLQCDTFFHKLCDHGEHDRSCVNIVLGKLSREEMISHLI